MRRVDGVTPNPHSPPAPSMNASVLSTDRGILTCTGCPASARGFTLPASELPSGIFAYIAISERRPGSNSPEIALTCRRVAVMGLTRQQPIQRTIPMKPRLWWGCKTHNAKARQYARVLLERFRTNRLVARFLASSLALLDLLWDAIGPFLRREGVRRGLLFGLALFLILGVLAVLLARPSTFSLAQTIVVSVLVLMSVVAMLVMDLFD